MSPYLNPPTPGASPPKRGRLTLTRALLAVTALVGTVLAVPQSAEAASQTYTVDLGTTTGKVLRGSNGALYGQSDDGVPGDNLLAPLKLTTGSQKPPNGAQHPNGDILDVAPSFFRNGGGTMYTNIQDMYSAWPYQNLGLSDYLTKVDTAVDTIEATSYADKVVFVPFNEPDGNWYTGLTSSNSTTYATARDSFLSDWKTVYQRIRSDFPGAKIGGPNTAVWNQRLFGDFLTFARDNDVLPDVFTWHELDPSSLANYRDHYTTYRSLESARGISPITINIDEYGNRRDMSVPGQLAQWAAMFEDTKVYAQQPYWDIAGNMDGNTVQANIPNGSWWFWRWYAGMTGQTVRTTPPQADVKDTLQGMASLDTGRRQAQVIVGGSASDTDVVIDNIPGATFGSKVEVTVQALDWSGYEGASAPPRTISRTAYTPSNGSITVPLTGLNAMSAYRITVTPNGGGTATAPSVPWSASYEAENAAITNGTVVTQATGDNYGTAQRYATSGTKDVGYLTASDSKVVFGVSVPSAGTYNLRVFYGNMNGSPSQQVLRVDGADPKFVTYPSTLNWQYRSTVTVPVTLGAGSHTVSLAVTDPTLGTSKGQVTLDKIDLTAAQSTPETVYEATFADISGNPAFSYDSIGETGTGRLIMTNGDKATFDVYAPADGYYTVKTDYSSAGHGTTLALNGNSVATYGSSGGKATTSSTRLYLAAGVNRIAVGPDSGTMLSLRDLKAAGAGDTTGVTKYEAESATLAGQAKAQSDSWASGGKNVGYVGGGSANTLTFANVSASAAGRYTVVVHYAHNDRSGSGNYNTNVMSRTAQLSVNGGTATTMTFRNTYSWNDYWALPTTVSLGAGTNTLKFSNSSAWAPDLDYIEVAPVSG
ncbi:CBM35 domain-containing protein [Streptomyces cylindrosporus]|uniref:Carbohydrate-binding protein n=1 Tax=Streptomyces cylindrosporus TaxID=2927583 RepID=A0ABS9Y2C7_9ACTN|nr:CBM35 domain-containing protein [Streptomyces cylindrosporus]MCI3270685.1 carbohydrate-binding protein [Streptomyces cylindrosporus]